MSEAAASSTSTDSQSTTYYNTSTHETKTLSEMVSAGWLELSEATYGDTYQYPALYNTTTHDVLDMTEGDISGNWMVLSSSSDNSSSDTTSSSTSTDSQSTTYYNSSTYETKTLTEMVSAGWLELSEATYGDAYQYPALYNTTTHDVLDMTEGDISGDWMVASIYYNTSTKESKTLTEMVSAGWIELSQATYGDAYQYPAIYSAGVISDENGPIRQALDMSAGDKVGDWIVLPSKPSENTLTVGTTNNDFTADSQGFSSISAPAPVTITTYEVGKETTLDSIKDYGGNLHGGDTSEEASSAYEYQGMLDVNGDGTYEAIFTNKVSKRWVTAEVQTTLGAIDFDRNGSAGATRVVGVYEDPLVQSGNIVDGSDHDSATRFQNDLGIDNLIAKHSGDYDSDGVSEVYWKTNDGTAYLRALMHDDGNIRYANYQSEAQMNEYLTAQGHDSVISEII